MTVASLSLAILEQHCKEPPFSVVEMNNIFQARIEEIFSMDAEAKKLIPSIQVVNRIPYSPPSLLLPFPNSPHITLHDKGQRFPPPPFVM